MSRAQGAELLGRTLGHYRISEQLGAGGMGVVYLARDLKLERDVALELLPKELVAVGGETAAVRARSEGDRRAPPPERRGGPVEDGLPRKAGEPRRLTHGEGAWHVHNPSWYPDGERLILSRTTVEGDVYMLAR